MSIHPTAIVDATAKLGENVSVGAYTVIGGNVQIGSDTIVGPHVVINGPTKIGTNNHIFQFASIGDAPQDKKYNGEPTELIIGDRNVFRECCTINRGTVTGHGVTRIGSDDLSLRLLRAVCGAVWKRDATIYLWRTPMLRTIVS